MEIVNVGIIGCGGFGNFHIDNLLKMENIVITALVTSNAKRAEDTAKKLNNDVQIFKNHKEMLEAVQNNTLKLDAVVISVPPGKHEDIECCMAENKINMYIEKPIGISMEQAKKNAEIIQKSGIICSVGYQSRYEQELKELKKIIASKKTGLITAKWIGGFPGVGWWKNKSLSGGQIVEQSTHLADMLRYLYGDIKSVYASGAKGINDKVKASDIEDYSAAVLTFKSGVIGTLITSCYIDQQKVDSDVSMHFYMEDMCVSFDWGTGITYKTKEETVSKPLMGNAHFTAMQEFVNAVRTGDNSNIRSNYSDALKTLEVTLAANESMQTGQAIKLIY